MGQREREQFRRQFLTDADRIARFLWLHPKIIHLQKQHTDADIQNALTSFPKDLVDLPLTGHSVPQVALVKECFKYISWMSLRQPDHIETRFLTYASNHWPEYMRHAEAAGEELAPTFVNI